MLTVLGTCEKISGYKEMKGDFFLNLEILQNTYRAFLKPFQVPGLNL